MTTLDISNLREFLDYYNLQPVDVYGDGFCFFSCVRLYMVQYCGNFLTLRQIKDMIRTGILNYDAQWDELKNQLLQELETYFSTGLYNNDYVDYFIAIFINVLSVHIGIVIVDETNNTSQFRFQFLRHDNRCENVIILLKEIVSDGEGNQSVHYKLLLPINHRINYTISQFSTSIGIDSSSIQSLSRITITSINRNQGKKNFHLFK